MPSTSMASLRRKLDLYGLREAVLENDQAMIEVRADAAGLVHCEYRPCEAGRAVPRTKQSAAQLLASAEECACYRDLPYRPLNPAAWTLLDAHEAAASAARAAGKPTAAGTTSRLTAALNRSLRSLPQYAAKPELAVEVDRALRLVQQALATLTDATGTDQARTQALDLVRGELLPKRLVGKVALDDEPYLMGIWPTMEGTHKTREVITALTVPGARAQLMIAPRWVADYLYREMYRSHETAWIACIRAGALTPAAIRHAARLWDPGSGGPMGDLAVAVQAATDLDEPSGS